MEKFRKEPERQDVWTTHEDGKVYYPYDPTKLTAGSYIEIFKQTSWGQKYELASDLIFADAISKQNVKINTGTTVELRNINTDNQSEIKLEILVYLSPQDTNPLKYQFERKF